MGKADDDIEGGRGDVPGFHHRDIGGRQQAAAGQGMVDPGQEDPVGPPAQDGGDQGFLLTFRIAGFAQDDLVAGIPEPVAEELDRFGIDRVGDGRDDGRDQPASPGGQAAGQQVGDITGAGDGLVDLLQGFRGDLVRMVQAARDGDRRNTGKLGDIVQGDAAGGAAGAAVPGRRGGAGSCSGSVAVLGLGHGEKSIPLEKSVCFS